MHLPDHYLDPTTCLVAGAISTGAAIWSVYRLRHEPRHVVMLLPAVSAGIFAAQMLNFPIAAGTSGHFLGGALAGILLGPWAGMVAMAIVGSVQAIFFGDGGIAALGANVLNMAVLTAPLGAGIARSMHGVRGDIKPTPLGDKRLPLQSNRPSRCLIGAAVAGAATVLAGALASSIEMVASGTFTAAQAVPAMLAAHAPIAVAEAVMTAATVATLFALRANVRAHQPVQSRTRPLYARRTVIALALTVLLVIALSPLASELPDGLESVAGMLAPVLVNTAPVLPSLFGAYALPGIADPTLATALAGLLGVLVVATSAASLVLLPKRSPFQAVQ